MRNLRNKLVYYLAGFLARIPVEDNQVAEGATHHAAGETANAEHRPAWVRDELLERILDKYEIDSETAASDLDALLAELKQMGVVEE